MSSFDDRKKSLEKKFANDQELQFKIKGRRNKYFGKWAAEKLEKKDQEIEKLNSEIDNFKKMIEESNNLYESMLDKTTKSLEQIIEKAESKSQIQ